MNIFIYETIMAWLLIAAIMGRLTEQTSKGFWPGFILSAILTPIASIIFYSKYKSDESKKYTMLNGSSVTDELIKLKHLNDEGILSDQEFEQQKKILLK